MSQVLVIIAILIGAVVSTPAQPRKMLSSYNPTFSAAESLESNTAQIGVSSQPGAQSLSSRFLLPFARPSFHSYSQTSQVIPSYIPGASSFGSEVTSFDNAPGIPSYIPSMPSSYPGMPVNIPDIATNTPSVPSYMPSMPSYVPSMPSYMPNMPSYTPNMASYMPSYMPSNNVHGGISYTQFGPANSFDSYQQNPAQSSAISAFGYPSQVPDYNVDPYNPYPNAEEVFSKQPSGGFNQFSLNGGVVHKQVDFPKTPAYYLARSVNAIGDLGNSVTGLLGIKS